MQINYSSHNCRCHVCMLTVRSLPEICRLKCHHGHCNNQRCECENGWAGVLCDQLSCDRRCDGLKGSCQNGTCICRKGWNGKHCTIGRESWKLNWQIRVRWKESPPHLIEVAYLRSHILFKWQGAKSYRPPPFCSNTVRIKLVNFNINASKICKVLQIWKQGQVL